MTEQKDFIANAVSYGLAAAKLCLENFGAYEDEICTEDVDNLVGGKTQ